MNTIIRDGYTLQYRQLGDSNQSPIIVIGSAIYYPRLFQNSIFKTLNLIFIDHRGFSQSTDPNAGFQLADIVEDIEAIRAVLNIEKAYFLGHSGHGFMAMAYAEKYPEHVAGIILSNLAPTNTKKRQDGSIAHFENSASDERKHYFYQEISKLESDIINDPTHRFTHINVRMQAHSFYQYDYDGAYLWDDVSNNMPALDYLWGVAFAKFDTKAFIDNCKMPIMILLSEYDYLVSPINLWDPILENRDIQPIIFHKSGHNPMLEEPEKYLQALQTFTKKMNESLNERVFLALSFSTIA